MSVLLIRHAHAGDRAAWSDPDHLRPLTTRGRREATALVELFAGYEVARVLTSPARRCVETVAPLAAARGLEVEEHDGLAEGAPLDRVEPLLRIPAAALCSHGDVIGAVLRDLAARGVDLGPDPGLAKGSTWVLDVARGTARYVRRPEVG